MKAKRERDQRRSGSSIVAMAAGILLLLLAGCSWAPIVNGTYFSEAATPAELGFVPKGENWAPAATVFTSSSLEDNLGLVNPDQPNVGTWREFALWIGWIRTNLNDGVVTSPETGGDGASSGWSTISADPEDNLPAWVIYDFGQEVPIKTVGLFPRTDTPVGPNSNLPQDFQFFTSNATNLDFDEITANSEDIYDTGPAAAWLPMGTVRDEFGNEWDEGAVTHSGGGFPASAEEQLFVFDNVRNARYFMIYIARAGGNFVQMTEMAVYGP